MTEPVTPPAVATVPVAPAVVAPAVPAAPVAAPTDNQPKMPEGLDPQFWDPAAGVKTDELVKAFAERSTKLSGFEAKLAEVPETPDGYKLDLPADFKAPEGVKVSINEKDPRLAPAREFAKAQGMTQGQFSAMLALDAKMKVQEAQAAEAFFHAEKAKLGEKGPARVEAVTSFLKANLSPDEFSAMQSVATNVTAVAAMEKLISKATAAGIPGSQNTGSQPGPAPKTLEQVMYPDMAQQKKVV